MKHDCPSNFIDYVHETHEKQNKHRKSKNAAQYVPTFKQMLPKTGDGKCLKFDGKSAETTVNHKEREGKCDPERTVNP